MRAPAVEDGGDAGGDLLRCRLHRVGGEVGIAGRRLDLGVAEQLADHRQAFAKGHGARREALAEVGEADRQVEFAVPAEFRRWVWAGGRRLKGLVRRREAEAALYAG